MPSVCFYFQVHQPFRLKRYSFFNVNKDHNYFDDEKNRYVLQKVAKKCYLPANRTILKLIRKYDGAFRVGYSLSGLVLEQMKQHCPDALNSFVELADTGCVEFMAESYYHTLAALYDVEEFKEQVKKHTKLIQELFGQTPSVFRNTELIYNDSIGRLAAEMGYKAVLAEGADDVLGWRSPNFVYSTPGGQTRLLLKNYRLSDDIAFRFSNKNWPSFPLTAEKYANWVHRISGAGDTVNLFMDYETFGEHQWADTGIFDFMGHLPEAILAHPHWSFLTPSQVIEKYPSCAELSFQRTTSWADVERDVSAWCGNGMQKSAISQVYELGRELKAAAIRHGDESSLDSWRKLLTSDHFYYMCTKGLSDGAVHAYFNAFESPYEAFINYMNVLRDLKARYLNVQPNVAQVSGVHGAVAKSITANGNPKQTTNMHLVGTQGGNVAPTKPETANRV